MENKILEELSTDVEQKYNQKLNMIKGDGSQLTSAMKLQKLKEIGLKF